MRTVTLLALGLAVAACATPRETEVLVLRGAPTEQVVDLSQCQQLGSVEGVGPGGWGTTRDQQEYWARTDAAALGAALGATHVAILRERDDPVRMTVDGLAYQCR